jgi:hypothetical protein
MLATCSACRHLYLRRIVDRPGSDRVRFRELVAGAAITDIRHARFRVDFQLQRFVQSQRILFARREKSTQKVGATTIALGQGCRSEETRACPSPKPRPAARRLIFQLGSGDNGRPMITTLLPLLRLFPFLCGGHR